MKVEGGSNIFQGISSSYSEVWGGGAGGGERDVEEGLWEKKQAAFNLILHPN